jgi:hypothetical protein
MRRSAFLLLAFLAFLLSFCATLGLLRLLPQPLTPASVMCAESPTPRLCRMIERAAGAPGAAEDLGQGPADLSPPPPDLSHLPPLVAGGEALRRGWPALAYRRCEEAAAQAKGAPSRGAALLCQGRAALALGWPQKALYLGQRALELYEDAPALLLIGDAYAAQGECAKARPLYLRALELQPGHLDAEEGLRRCSADRPAPRPAVPDLTMRAGLPAQVVPGPGPGTTQPGACPAAAEVPHA